MGNLTGTWKCFNSKRYQVIMLSSQDTSPACTIVLFTLASLHFTTQHLGRATWITSPCQQFREKWIGQKSQFLLCVHNANSCFLHSAEKQRIATWWCSLWVRREDCFEATIPHVKLMLHYSFWDKNPLRVSLTAAEKWGTVSSKSLVK